MSTGRKVISLIFSIIGILILAYVWGLTHQPKRPVIPIHYYEEPPEHLKDIDKTKAVLERLIDSMNKHKKNKSK